MMPALAMAALLGAALAGDAQRLPGADIVRAVEAAAMDRLASAHSTARVTVAGRVADQLLPAGDARIELGQIAEPWPRARAGLPVLIKVDGRLIRTMTVWVELRDPRTVLTYAHDYPKGHPVGDLQLREATVDMACCPGVPVAQASQVASLRAKRAVRAGAPVMQGDFEVVPDVASRQRVAIEVLQGPVRLTASGVALSDGHIGDRIAVRADASQAVLHGHVVAKQKVVVDE